MTTAIKEEVRRAVTGAAPAADTQKKKKRRKWLTNQRLFQLHGWLGVNLGLLLFVICFSGAFAALSHELDWLANPAIRVTPQAERVSWATIYDNVRRAYPQAYVSSIHSPLGPRFASEAMIATPERQTRRVYINPYTGAIQGDTSYFNVQRFFRSFHMMLFIERTGWLLHGLYIVSFFGFALLFSVISGFLFYKNWLRNLFALRRGKGQRVFWTDLHRLLGVWSLLFSLIISITGIWYFVEMIQFDIGHSWYIPPPTLSAEKLGQHGPTPRPLGVDEYARLAQQALPDLEIKTLSFPAKPDEPVYVDGQTKAWLVRDRASKVYLDPYDGEVIKLQRGEDLAPHYRWVDTADPLHFGDFGGLATKLLWAFLALLLPVSILSGAYISLRRARQVGQTPQPAARHGYAAPTTLTVGLLLWAAYATYHGINEYRPQPAPPLYALGERQVGDWRLSARLEGELQPNGKSVFRFAFSDPERRANYRRMHCRIVLPGDRVDQQTDKLAAVAGDWHELRAEAPTPAQVKDAELQVTITDWSGQESTAAFSLNPAGRQPSPVEMSYRGHALVGANGVVVVVALFTAITLTVIAVWFRAIRWTGW